MNTKCSPNHWKHERRRRKKLVHPSFIVVYISPQYPSPFDETKTEQRKAHSVMCIGISGGDDGGGSVVGGVSVKKSIQKLMEKSLAG